MVFGSLSRVVARRAAVRQNNGTLVKSKRNYWGEYDKDNRPGRNMPLTIANRWRFTVVYTIYWFTGVGFPFYVVYYQMTK